MFAADGFYLGVGNAVSVIIWLTVLIYWLGSFFYRLEGLQVLVLPAAAATVAAAAGAAPGAPACRTPSSRRSRRIC